MSTNPASSSAPQDFTNKPDEAAQYLSTFLDRTLRVHISDGRVFVGQLKCTDSERNLILAMTQEYRPPTDTEVRRFHEKHQGEDTEREGGRALAHRPKLEMKKRFVGMVVVPGNHIQKIEMEG
ncbi:hypothetical protein K431DRAFT_228832 [Polychaeton citri CBS 116435]|uniref:Sm domain-containing protein n=1 Tax=Polychaeton citri CBS 116435 TaxID=1314669 RepID=A0A9P4UNV8_9PEZI|nr:hypothetical protein K431DRAFT_228832 [Polychaeton citri CBS 116435]